MSRNSRNDRFEQAVSLLRSYTDSSSDKALLSALLTGSAPQSSNNTPEAQFEKLADNLVSVVKGGVFVSEFVTDLKNFLGEGNDQGIKDLVKGFVRITFPTDINVDKKAEVPPYANSSQLYGGPSTELTLKYAGLMNEETVLADTPERCFLPDSKKNPTLYAIELLNPKLGMTTRDAAPLSIFANLVPTIEMSRCVPYINTRISVSGSSPVDTEGRLQGLSLVTYLNGVGAPVSNLKDNLIDMVMLKKKDTDGQEVSQAASMEIFTSPQTLVSPPGSSAFNPTDGYTKVLDRFRPFMSMNSLSFTVQPTNGWLSYKTAQMEITLHDRSRLAQIAPFVNSNIYQSTELDIEYGWSHPAGNAGTKPEDNPMGVFLDGLRVREKYAIVNSSFRFDEAGQVGITLTLAMKGAPALQTVDISMAKTKSSADALTQAIKEISKKIDKLKGTMGDKFSKLYDETILGAVGSESSSLSLDEEALNKLMTKLGALEKSKDADQELVAAIEHLIGVDGEVQSYKKSVDTAVNEQLDEIFSGFEIFPCTDEQASAPATKKVSLGADIAESQSDATVENSVSFGKLMLGLVGKPLAKSGKYDEVQFIFHTFNEYSTFVRDLSIAKYPIARAELQEKLKDVLKTNMKVSCMQMIQLLVEFIHDPSAVPYGFRQLYEPAKDDDGKPTGGYERRTIDTDDEKKSEAYRVYQADYENYVIAKAGIPNGKFKIPKVTVYPECIPANSDTRKSILRINVVDETSSAFGSLFDLLKATRTGDITAFGLLNDPSHPLLKTSPELNSTNIKATRTAMLQKMKDDKVVSFVVETNNGDQKPNTVTVETDIGMLLKSSNVEKTKQFVSQGLPTITFGKGGGMVSNAGLSSLNDPQLATVNMMRMSQANAPTPEMSRKRGLPLRIAPSEVSVEMMGLPIVQYMQYVFVDFKTGTTADNIYAINGIDHKISAGEFTTSLKLVAPGDAYAEYESPKKKLEIQSDILRSYLGMPPAEKKPLVRPNAPAGTGKSSSGGSGSGSSGGGGGGGGGGESGSASGSGTNGKTTSSKDTTDTRIKFWEALKLTQSQAESMNGGAVILLDYAKKKVISVDMGITKANIDAYIKAHVKPENPTGRIFLTFLTLNENSNGYLNCRIYDAQNGSTPEGSLQNLSTWLTAPSSLHTDRAPYYVGENNEWRKFSTGS